MEELGLLVEVRGVVLVALDDEPGAASDGRVRAEVRRRAADEIAGVLAVLAEHPREHRRRRRLAVRTRDHERPARDEEKLFERLRKRRRAEPALARRRGLGVRR